MTKNSSLKRGSKREPDGLWLIDKPVGISSFGVVARLRRATDTKKVGHAGTLDPLASGLMLLLVGREFTREAQSLLKRDKTYKLTITLGANSTTDDNEGEKEVISDRVPLDDEVQAVIQGLTGEIMQTPPVFSAIKVGGQRAYKLAREGKPPVMAARPTTIYVWRDVKYSYPTLSATVDVSSGTYIRSLAREMGERLNVGGYLTALRRTRIGEFDLADAQALDEVDKI